MQNCQCAIRDAGFGVRMGKRDVRGCYFIDLPCLDLAATYLIIDTSSMQ
jgi:hypothetical protein